MAILVRKNIKYTVVGNYEFCQIINCNNNAMFGTSTGNIHDMDETLIVNCYIPPASSAYCSSHAFETIMLDILELVHKHQLSHAKCSRAIFVGDFNARMGTC